MPISLQYSQKCVPFFKYYHIIIIIDIYVNIDIDLKLTLD